MKTLLDLLFERLATFLAAATLAIALIAMAAQVVFRYALDDSLVWSEEVARYALLWSTMMGAAVAYRQGGHVAITDLVTRLPIRFQILLYRLVHLLVLGFAAVLSWQGWSLAMRNFAREQLSPALQIDIAWIYLAMPVGGALIALAALEGLWRGAAASRGAKAA